MKIILPSRSPGKVSGTLRVPGPYFENTLLWSKSCTCALWDTYKNSFIPQIFTEHLPCALHCSRHCECLKRRQTKQAKSLPAWSLHCNWQNVQSSIVWQPQVENDPNLHEWRTDQQTVVSPTMEYCTAVKTNGIQLHAWAGMGISKTRVRKKSHRRMISFTWKFKNNILLEIHT